LFRAVFALLDVIDWLGGRNPSFRFYVIDGGLNALRIVLGKKTQMFTADFHFGPSATG
jgi:hypothetical protein